MWEALNFVLGQKVLAGYLKLAAINSTTYDVPIVKATDGHILVPINIHQTDGIISQLSRELHFEGGQKQSVGVELGRVNKPIVVGADRVDQND